MTDTPEQDAEDAERIVARAHRAYAAEHDAHEETKRELRVLKYSTEGTIRMQRVTIASLKKDKAKLRREWAGIEGDHATYMLAVKQWESRTGLDMDKVLEGEYGKPWGIYGHNSLGEDDD